MEQDDRGAEDSVAARAASTPEGVGAASRLGRADLHVHTNLGDGTASPARVLREARRRGLDVIAVTDHDHLEGARRVDELLKREGATGEGAAERPIEMIWGCEVTTRDGHLLGLFIRQPVKMLQRAEATIEAIKSQGGLVVVPHPMGRLVPSLSRRRIEELLARGYTIDGIELYNPSPANARARGEVCRLNQSWGLAATGGSDAHFWQHIGAAYTLFPGRTAGDLRRAILEHTTRESGQEQRPERLPVATYVLQCGWSWFVDPPRKVVRMLRQGEQRI